MALETSIWAWSVQDLPPTCKLVLLHLADRANEQNNAWPTVRGIQTDTGLGRASVLRHLAKLRELELVYAIGYGGKTGQAVVYKLAGRYIPPSKTKGKAGWFRWSHSDSKWSHCDTPPGSPRDPGGITMIRGGSHGETHNQSTNQSYNQPATNHQPVAPHLCERRDGMGDGAFGTPEHVEKCLTQIKEGFSTCGM